MFLCNVTNFVGYNNLAKNFGGGSFRRVKELDGLSVRIQLIALSNVTGNRNSSSANLVSQSIVFDKRALSSQFVKKHGEFLCPLPYVQLLEFSHCLNCPRF